MTFRGYVKNGRVVVDEPLDLPDGTEIDVRPVKGTRSRAGRASGQRSTAAEQSPKGAKGRKTKGPGTLFERYKSFIGKADGLPTDFASQHDHYIHGTPKR